RDFHVTGVQTCALPIFLGRSFQFLALFFQAGDVREVVLRHVGQVDPTRLQARSRDFLDARQRLPFRLAEAREIDARDFRQCRAGTTACEDLLDERFYVFVQYPVLLAAAPDAGEIDTEFPCELAHRGTRVRPCKTRLID